MNVLLNSLGIHTECQLKIFVYDILRNPNVMLKLFV